MKINQKLCYIINYKPLLNYKKNLNNFNKIYCKNFFLFFLLLDYLKKNNLKTKLNIQKKKTKTYSFLRAPNKYKKAQIKIINIKYKIILINKFNYSFNNISKFNYFNLIYFLNFYFNNFLFFESTFFFLEKKSIELKLNKNYLNNFFFEL